MQQVLLHSASTTTQRAAAATNAEAEKVRVASRELNELLKNEDALRFKVLVEWLRASYR